MFFSLLQKFRPSVLLVGVMELILQGHASCSGFQSRWWTAMLQVLATSSVISFSVDLSAPRVDLADHLAVQTGGRNSGNLPTVSVRLRFCTVCYFARSPVSGCSQRERTYWLVYLGKKSVCESCGCEIHMYALNTWPTNAALSSTFAASASQDVVPTVLISPL